MKKFLASIILPTVLWVNLAFAQKQDSTIRHSSKLAVYLSAAIPGAGQIYNRQIYKTPFIYLGLWYSYKTFQRYNVEYWKVRNDIITIMNGFDKELTYNKTDDITQLKSIKETYRSRRDLNALLFIGIWTLNVLDAYVNAEFYNFDVSPDLSLNLKPIYLPNSQNLTWTIALTYKF